MLLSVRELFSTHFSSNVEYCASYTMAREILLYYSVNGKLTASCAICRQHLQAGLEFLVHTIESQFCTAHPNVRIGVIRSLSCKKTNY